MLTSTSSNSFPVVQPPDVPTEPVWRLNLVQYHEMIRVGILTADDPVELLEGWLVYKMPKNPPHRATTKLTRSILESMIPAGWYVDSQEPITLVDSEPEPDLAVIQGDTRDYLDRHPSGAEIALIIEVAESTLERDRTVKKRLYARAGIPIYWIINLVDQYLEEYRSPISSDTDATYQQKTIYQPTDQIAVVIANQEIGKLTVRDLLP